MPVSDLGRRLRDLRRRKRLSIYDVERRTGIHFSTISKYERNERRPSLEVLRELAALYEVPVASLVGDVTDLKGVLTPEQLRWLGLLDRRPDLARLLEAAAALSPARVEALVRFLADEPSAAGAAGDP